MSLQNAITENNTRSSSVDSSNTSIFDPSSSPTCSIHAEDDWSTPETPKTIKPSLKKIRGTIHRRCHCCSRTPKYCRNRKIHFRNKSTRTPYNLRLLSSLPSLPDNMQHDTHTVGNWTIVEPSQTKHGKSTYMRKLILTVLQYHNF